METGAKKIRLFRTLKTSEILTEIPYATLDSTSQQCPCGAADDEGLRNRQKFIRRHRIEHCSIAVKYHQGQAATRSADHHASGSDLGTGVLFELYIVLCPRYMEHSPFRGHVLAIAEFWDAVDDLPVVRFVRPQEVIVGDPQGDVR